MNLYNLFEDDNRTPNPNYAEELAYQIFKAAPNLDTTGAADEVLDYAFDLAVNDLGRRRAHSLFAYDEDFDSDLVNAYLDLQMNKSAEDKKQVNEVDPHNFDSDVDYYAARNAPAKPRSHARQSPGVNPDDEDYFREIFRKKREAAKKAEQDKEQGVAEGRVQQLPTRGADYSKYGTDHLKMMLRPGILHRNEARFKALIRKELQKREQQGVAEGMLDTPGEQDSPVAQAIIRRILLQRTDLLAKYGPEKVGAAVDEVADFVGDVEEIGSSDVSGWVRHVEQMLGNMGDQGVAESDKKKEDGIEPQIRDVALQRAISRAKADFPTAGTGIEALAKDFMRSQDQDQKSFDQMRQTERKQDQMLGQIAKIDQEQEKEINDLDNQNSTLASRLQQLQNVNGELEKKLAAMSGRKAEKKSKTDTATEPAVAPTASSPELIKSTTKKAAKTKLAAPKSSMKSIAAQLAAPKVDPMAAMTNRITKGDSSVIDKVSGQSALPFEPSDNVLEPVIPQAQVNPRFAAARANASDADPRYYADLTSKIAKDAVADPKKALQTYRVHEGDKPEKVERPEADYGDEYQDMVKRVKHLAGQGPRKTVWDPVKRVYKTVPTNK